MKLVLFDIDGTMLWTDGAGRRAIHRALLDVTGTAGRSIRTLRRQDRSADRARAAGRRGTRRRRERDAGEAVCRRYVDLLKLELARNEQRTKLFPACASCWRHWSRTSGRSGHWWDCSPATCGTARR